MKSVILLVRGLWKLTVYYTRVNVFSIYLLLFVYRCVLFFKTSSIFGKVSARSGIVSLFTCVTTVFLSKHKTNLVPSFLPALSSSTCIISLANQYNTSVDTAIVQRLESDFHVRCLKVTVLIDSKRCCDHMLGSTVFMVGWETNDLLFFNITSTLILIFSVSSHEKKKQCKSNSSCQETN